MARSGRKVGRTTPLQPDRTDLLVPLQRVGGRVGRAEHFDAEAFEQRARAEVRTRETRVDVVVDAHRRRRRQRLGDAEDPLELVCQPGAARRPAKQVEVVGEPLPDPARVGLGRPAVEPGNTQRLHRHALRVEHAHDVVVGHDDERRRIRKALVEREQPGIDVPVRAHQRKLRRARVELARQIADLADWAEVPVGMQHVGSIGEQV